MTTTRPRLDRGVDLNDPTAVAIAAAQGLWKDREEDALCMYNFMDVTEMEDEMTGTSTRNLSSRIKKKAAALLGVSRAHKDTEHVLNTENCVFKEVPPYEELMATTFEPLKDPAKMRTQDATKLDSTLEKHRGKYNYMVIDSVRVAISSLLQTNDTRECVMYLCDRRIEDPILGALALISFSLQGMTTHIYKTGRILAFSRQEKIAAEHLQLYLYVKGPKLLKKDNTPVAVNVKTSFLFGNNAENVLKHNLTMNTEGDIVSFMSQNAEMFAWMQTEVGRGLGNFRNTSMDHSNRKSILERWANPVGNVSRRITHTEPRVILQGESSSSISNQNQRDDDQDVIVERRESRPSVLRIGRSQSGLLTTTPDLTPHKAQDFVQDSEIKSVQASLSRFMENATVDSTLSLYKEQFTRPVMVDTFVWKSTDAMGHLVAEVELPGDLIGDNASSMYSDTMQRAFCFRNDFRIHVIMAGNESYTGAVKLCIDQLRRLHEAGQDDELVYHSMEGITVLAQDTNGSSLSVPFMSIHDLISAHDKNSHNALSRLTMRVIAPLTHCLVVAPTLSITLQIFVENVEARHIMWRSLEATFPVSRGTSLPSVVGNGFGRMRGSSTTILGSSELLSLLTQKAFLGQTTIRSDTVARAQIAEFALHPMSSRISNGGLFLSQLAAISALFSYWKGSLIVTFEIDCSSSTRGKLVLTIAPKGGVPIIGLESVHHGMGAEFDLGTSTTRSFVVPFVSTDEWESIGDEGIMSAFEGTWDCPVARLIVLHPITSTGATTPSVTVRCYLEPGHDFTLRGRHHIGLQTSLRGHSLGVGQNGNVNILANTDFALMSIVDFDALEDAYTLQMPCAPWYSKQTLDYTILQNPLHWASRLYTLWRGDIEYRVVIVKDNMGDQWESPISLWFNPTATMETCQVKGVKSTTLAKETFNCEKISLAQQSSFQIVAEDDRRFRWRLCKLLDTTHERVEGVKSTTVEYTGHPKLSSHTGVVFLEFPKNSISGRILVYTRPCSNFQFSHIGGVPSLKLDKMEKFRLPFQPFNNKDKYYEPTAGHSGARDLATGVAQGSTLKNFRQWIYPSTSSPTANEENEAEQEAPEPRGVLADCKEVFSQMLGKISTFLKNSMTNLLSSAIMSAMSSFFSSTLDKIFEAMKSFLSCIGNVFSQCLKDPACLCIIGLTISAIAGFSALKMMESILPEALGIFKSLLTLIATSLAAIYWPQGALALATLTTKSNDLIREICEDLHCYFFDRERFYSKEGPFGPLTDMVDKPLEDSANADTTSKSSKDSLKTGTAQGGLMELIGLAAYIRLCFSLCEAFNVSMCGPFSLSNMEKHCRVVSGVGSGIRNLCDFRDYIYKTIVNTLTPSTCYLKISKELGFDIREWFLEVETLSLQENRYSDLSNPLKIKAIRLAYDKGMDVMGKLSQIDSAHLSRICDKTFRLSKELLDETHKFKGLSGNRIDPFHISLFGEPGVGKSFIMGKLVNDVLDFMGEPACDRSYSKTPDEQYWSGYIGQTAIKCDDLGQDLSKGYSPTYNQIIQMKTNNCFVVPMADLANKGRTFVSKYIFSTTNVADCGTKHGLAEPQAFMRRRDLFVRVTTDGVRVPGMVDNLRFTFLDPLDPEERNMRYPPELSYSDFLCACVAEARMYFEVQEKVLATLNDKSGKGIHEPTPTMRALLEILDPTIAQDIGDLSKLMCEENRTTDYMGMQADSEKKKDRLIPDAFSDCSSDGFLEDVELPDNYEVTAEDIERRLRNGKAQGASYSSFQCDAMGKPIISPFIGMFGKHRDAFNKEKHILLTDDDLHHFGTLLMFDDFRALQPAAETRDLPGVTADNVFNSFFQFIFRERLPYIQEQDLLQHFHVFSASTITRLSKAVHVEFNAKGNLTTVFDSEVDEEIFQSLSYIERVAFYICCSIRKSRMSRQNSVRVKLSKWFLSVKEFSTNLLDSLPSLAKILIVLATSCGAIFLALKSVKGMVSIAHGIFGVKNSVGNPGQEASQIDLASLVAQGGRGKGKARPTFHSGDELTQRVERMISRAQLAVGRSQGGQSAEATEDHLLQRMGTIRNMVTGSTMVGINIGSGMVLSPLHLFADAQDNDMLEFRWGGVCFYFLFLQEKIHQLKQYDVCIIDTDLAVPARTLNISIFMDETELEKYSDVKCSFVCGPWANSHGGFIENDLVAKREKSFKYTVKEMLVMAVHGWSVAHRTYDGQCGSCLVSKDTRVNGKVFGMLVAGTMDRSGEKYYGTYVPITKQMILQAISSFATTNLATGESHMNICGIPVDPDLKSALELDTLITSEPSSLGTYGVYTAGKRIGCVQAVGRTTPLANLLTSEKTSIIPSLIQDKLWRAPQTEPAILSSNDPRIPEGTMFDPILDGIKKYAILATPFAKHWKDMILRTFNEDMLDWEVHMIRGEHSSKDLCMDILINGIDGAEYYESINMSTSEGFPFITKRPKESDSKKWLFTRDEDTGKYAMSSEELRSSYEAYGRALQNGTDFPLLCIECPKDERRPLAKIYEKPKTRLFSVLPVEFNLHARRLFLDFNVYTMANRHKHGIMVGINPHSREWTDLALSLASFSPFGFNGDFANFDGMFHPQAFQMVSELADSFYGGHNGTQRKTLTRALTNRLSIVKGAVVHIPGGGPSGFPMTVIFNSYINLFYLMSAWYALALENGRKDIADPCFFRRYVRAAVYGDDNLVAIKEEVIEWYNLCSVSLFLKEYFGVEMTDGDKNSAQDAKPYGRILEFDFLKRGFVADELIPSLFHAPLNKRSIEEQVFWIREGGDTYDLLMNNAENALYEAHHHGREYFSFVRGEVSKAISNIGHSGILSTYLMCRQRWLTNDLGESAIASGPSISGRMKAVTKDIVLREEENRNAKEDCCLDNIEFLESKDSFGSPLFSGPLQQIIPGVWIASRREIKAIGEGFFPLILDNTLSKGQERFGARHGICSLSAPDFGFLEETASIFLSAWPCRVVCVDISGGHLALATALCLLSFVGAIRVNRLCSAMRAHIGSANKVLSDYFRYCESIKGKEVKEAATRCGVFHPPQMGSAKDHFLCGDQLFRDSITLPTRLSRRESLKRTKKKVVQQDEDQSEEVDI
uniref:Genome polyprotein n=1 Tax=Cowslip sequivirus TaxID=3115813 RepID=A0AAT9J7X2_9SECO